MAPDALRMLARQLRRDPNPDAIEDAACALEALAIGHERQARRPRPPGARRAMMQALEDDMEAGGGVYRRLAAP